MKIRSNQYAFDEPKRRPLKIFASDPMAGKSLGNRVTVEIENEPVDAGPSGERICVVDFNATTNKYYPALNLDDPNVLMQGGLAPTESDPRFHQQMVYAVAMRTLENFDKALGRRIHISRAGKPLRLFPHAFNAANAFFDPDLHAVLFGYFRADSTNAGDNLPGQTVFTCLSHDIIAHEVTHAIVHRLRRHLLEPSNVDVLAFHEGFADLVSLFQHFSFAEVLKGQIQQTGSNLRQAKVLLGLAQQFGHATAMGRALRSALNDPEIRLGDDVSEPHERGAILVAAVFDAFIKVYETRTTDLLRLSSAGGASLHPDLVNRLAAEAARIAQGMLTTCIRAFDYLPPVDVTFGDFLRAVVTADMELSPEDELGLRAALIEGFRLRGIYPEGVTSLAEESLVWEPVSDELPKLVWEPGELLDLIVEAATRLTPSSNALALKARKRDSESSTTSSQYDADNEPDTGEATSALSRAVHQYATQNAEALKLDPGEKIQALGVHPVFRVAPSGRLAIELVVQIAQRLEQQPAELGDFPARGGTTLIVSFDGTVKYAIAKPLPMGAPEGRSRDSANRRLARQAKFMQTLSMQDPRSAYALNESPKDQLRATFKNLHLAR
jgi:hypothetical protein